MFECALHSDEKYKGEKGLFLPCMKTGYTAHALAHQDELSCHLPPFVQLLQPLKPKGIAAVQHILTPSARSEGAGRSGDQAREFCPFKTVRKELSFAM